MRVDSEFDRKVDRVVAQKAGRGWLARMWCVVALFIMVTVAWSRHVGVPIRDPGGSMFVRRILLTLLIFAVFAVVDATIRSDRRWAVAAQLRSRWPKERLGVALSGLLAYHVVYLCYHNLKSWVVFNGFHDSALLNADRWLFQGHSPAVLLHGLLGEHVAAVVLAIVYESFSYLVPVSFVAAVVFVDRLRDGFVFLASAIWVWILGAGSYYLIPSLGPFATSPRDFDNLSRTLINGRQDTLLVDREHMLSHPAASDAFASIGAFASLHTGFTFMVVLMLHHYGLRRAAHVMTAYLVATITATIYFGYHFVVDDAAGLLLGLLAVMLGKLVVLPKSSLKR